MEYLFKDSKLIQIPELTQEEMQTLWVVTFGMYSWEDCRGDYSYWDSETAMKTFLMYQQMGWDYVSIGGFTVPL